MNNDQLQAALSAGATDPFFAGDEQFSHEEKLYLAAIALIADKMQDALTCAYHTKVIALARIDGMIYMAAQLLAVDADRVRSDAEKLAGTP